MDRARTVRAIGLISAAVVLSAAGCRREGPPPPPDDEPAGAAATEAPVRLPPAAGTTDPRESPGDGRRVEHPAGGLAPAARPMPAQADAVKPGAGRRPALGTPAPAGLPEYLPRSGEAGEWTLTEFKRLSADSLEQAVPGEEARRIGAFGVKGAVTGGYRWESRGQEATASIVAIEAASAEDAYGLTTCASSSPVTERCGGLTRVDTGPGLRMATWQGRMALRASTPSAEPEAGTELRRLVQEIVSRIPREDPPDLLHAVPTASQIPGRQWIVRHLASLPPTAFPPGSTPDLGALSRLLGLNAGTLVFVSAHRVPRTDRPNVIWIVRYGAADDARQAHGRLNALLGSESGSSAAWQRVTAAPPRGRYVVGTWTAEEESLQHLIPRVLELLPS